MKLREKTIGSFLLVIAFLVVVGGIGIFNAKTSNGYLVQTVERANRVVVISSLKELLRADQQLTMELMDSADPKKLEDSWAEHKSNLESFTKRVETVINGGNIDGTLITPEIDQGVVSALKDALRVETENINGEMRKAYDARKDFYVSGASPEKDKIFHDVDVAIDSKYSVQVQDALNKAIGSVKGDFLESVKSGNQAFGGALLLIFIFAFVAIVVALLISVILSKGITSAVQSIFEGAKKIMDGDLHAHVDIKTGDELQDLGQHLNEMTENLGAIIGNVKESSSQLGTATKEIASSAQQIADGAQQQSASFEELSSSVQANAESAKDANSIAQDVAKGAQKAGQALDNTVEAMVSIEKGSKQMADAVIAKL